MALSDTPLSKIPVFVALSGGVDSAVAACLLKEKGHSVIGISHRHWPESRCCSTVCMDQSAMHCRQLGIPYHSIDCIVEFTQAIVEDFINHYENGITPNPCVLCNATIRFSLMMEKHLRSLEQPPDDYKLATGHYARVKKQGNQFQLRKGLDKTKDQSYMLYRLTQKELSHCLFPLGELTKQEVRALAMDRQLASAKQADSQDVCFVPARYQDFIDQYTGKLRKPGPLLSLNGEHLGEHKGLAYYTRGQRSGLGLSGGPWFVIHSNAKNNTITLGRRQDLQERRFTIQQCNWITDAPSPQKELHVQLRYRSDEFKCSLTPLPDGRYEVLLDENSTDVCPGQSAVFYAGDCVLGGGIIAPLI